MENELKVSRPGNAKRVEVEDSKGVTLILECKDEVSARVMQDMIERRVVGFDTRCD